MDKDLENITASQCKSFQELDENDPGIALGNFVFGEGYCGNYEFPIFNDHQCPPNCAFYDPQEF